MAEFPKFISVDDHVIEPPNVWQDRLPQRFKERGPTSFQQRGTMNFIGGVFSFEPDEKGEVGRLVAVRGSRASPDPS
jgi:hypothetical protein